MLGQLLHPGLMVSEHSQGSYLSDREPVVCGDPSEYPQHQEGELNESIGETQVVYRMCISCRRHARRVYLT
jgi:hypothetical protein